MSVHITTEDVNRAVQTVLEAIRVCVIMENYIKIRKTAYVSFLYTLI